MTTTFRVSSGLVLSLFPGIGLFDRAFEEEGFCIVRGPDLLWGGDIRSFHPPGDRFDGVIGGPPCQAFSSLHHLVAHNHKKDPTKYKPAANLIPEFERCVAEARPGWFLMENVPAAPEPVVEGFSVSSFLLDNAALPDGKGIGQEQTRRRRFSFGRRGGPPVDLRSWIELAVLSSIDTSPAVLSGGTTWIPVRIGGSGKRKSTSGRTGGIGRPYGDRSVRYFQKAVRLQGLPESWDLPGFTVAGKIKALGNAVPLAMGRALARAVREATR